MHYFTMFFSNGLSISIVFYFQLHLNRETTFPLSCQDTFKRKSIGDTCSLPLKMSGSVWFLLCSELIAIQHSHCVDATMKEEEKQLETESPSEKRNSPRILFGSKDAPLPSEKVCISLSRARHFPARLPPD